MKKNIIFIAIIAITFIACNPNEEIYDAIDEANNEAFHKIGMEYTITTSDYAKISQTILEIAQNNEDTVFAESIASYNSFNAKYSAFKYVPVILSDNFPVYQDSSTVMVTFNKYIGDMFGDIKSTELIESDYINIGGSIADTACFTENDEPNDYLPSILLTKFPDAIANNYATIKYLYPDSFSYESNFYKFNGVGWTLEDAYVLNENDYAEMGEPGNHNNFSEDAMPADYLPQLLNTKYPYAQAKEEKVIVCDLHGFNDPIYAITCIYNGENWDINFPGLKYSFQFKHDGEVWYFDPTARFTLGASDFQLIVDYISTIYPDLVNSYGSGDFYTGASSYYSNFDIRISKRREEDPNTYSSLSDEDALALIWERVEEGLVIMLQSKYPDATPSIEGLDVNYYLTFDAFNDAYKHVFYNAHYICTSEGTPPTFELVGTIDEIVTEE